MELMELEELLHYYATNKISYVILKWYDERIPKNKNPITIIGAFEDGALHERTFVKKSKYEYYEQTLHLVVQAYKNLKEYCLTMEDIYIDKGVNFAITQAYNGEPLKFNLELCI